MAERPRGFEYKHVECPQVTALVDVVTNDHAKFYWELTGTQTVVAKESHLESGDFNPDNLYSVTTTERFVAMDFRRATDTANLQEIKKVENDYFQLCAALSNVGASPLDSYSTPPAAGNPLLAYILLVIAYCFYIVPGILFQRSSLFKNLKTGRDVIEQYQVLKPKLDALLRDNSSILNIAS